MAANVTPLHGRITDVLVWKDGVWKGGDKRIYQQLLAQTLVPFPQSVATDTTYGNGELLAWLEERDITPYIRVKESPAPKTNLYGIEKFTYVAETNVRKESGSPMLASMP